jgi:gliding motility-associated-like protein
MVKFLKASLMLKHLLSLLLLLLGNIIFGQEICNNGKDDDLDGLIDLNDPDCHCAIKASGNLLLNPSFEEFNYCRREPLTYLNNYDRIKYWEYGVSRSGNIYHYRNLSCEVDSFILTVDMMPTFPLPDGIGFVVIHQGTTTEPNLPESKVDKSYIAQCLQTPLLKGEKYNLTFYAGKFKQKANNNFNPKPFSVAVFGHSDCSAVPFGQSGTTGNGCPTNHAGWVLLGSTTVYSKGSWVQSKIDLTIPKDINVIQIGPDCSLVPIGVEEMTNIYTDFGSNYLDNLQLLPTKDFNFQYIQVESGSACSDNYALKAPTQPGATYQWYKDSIAIGGATSEFYTVPESISTATYNVRITTGNSCQISEPFAVRRSRLYALRLPSDTSICKNDTLTLAKALPGVQFRWNGNTDSIIRISQPGTYYIRASDSMGCAKDFTVKAEYKECTACTVFVPKAFTPNGDGKNDVLRGRINCPVDKYHLQVYNRWGQKVFESRNPDTGWDGTYRGEKAPAEVYVYYVKFKHSSFEKNFKLVKGTVLIIR